MSWKGLVKVTFPSHLQTLMALFPKSKVLKGQVSRSASFGYQHVGIINARKNARKNARIKNVRIKNVRIKNVSETTHSVITHRVITHSVIRPLYVRALGFPNFGKYFEPTFILCKYLL